MGSTLPITKKVHITPLQIYKFTGESWPVVPMNTNQAWGIGRVHRPPTPPGQYLPPTTRRLPICHLNHCIS